MSAPHIAALYKLSRHEAHQIFKDMINTDFAPGILEKTRYRLDPASEAAMSECYRTLRRIAAKSRLVLRDAAVFPTGEVLLMRPRATMRLVPGSRESHD